VKERHRLEDLSVSKNNIQTGFKYTRLYGVADRLCGLVVRVLGSDPEVRVRFPALPEKKVVGLERGPLSLVNTTEELLDRKVAASV
jgi:hypothetical protein